MNLLKQLGLIFKKMRKISIILISICFFANASKSAELAFDPKNLEEHLMEIIPSLPDNVIEAKDGFLLNEAWLAEVNNLPHKQKTVMLYCLDWLGFTFAAAVNNKDNNLTGDDFEKKVFYHIHLKLNNKSLKYISAYAVMCKQKVPPLWKLYLERRFPSVKE
jgi:hypothetical protein